jgi:predicted heme/steroid binding protein
MNRSNRRGGIVYFKVDGERYDAKGNFSYNLGRHKREAVVGHDGVHGYKELPQVPYIEGELTDRWNLDLAKLLCMDNATVTLELANGKMIVLRNAWFASEGTVQTEEGTIALRFEGISAEEIQ